MKLREIVTAIENAHHCYEEMSGDWLWQGAEYFLTVCLAKHMKKKLADWVTLETPVENPSIDFRPGPRSRAMRSSGRFDIALWNWNGESYVITDVIEVKSSVRPAGCEADLERLAATTKGSKSVEGWLAYYFSQERPASGDIRKYLSGISKDLEDLAKKIKIADKFKIQVETSSKITKPEKYNGEFSAALCMCVGFKRDYSK